MNLRVVLLYHIHQKSILNSGLTKRHLSLFIFYLGFLIYWSCSAGNRIHIGVDVSAKSLETNECYGQGRLEIKLDFGRSCWFRTTPLHLKWIRCIISNSNQRKWFFLYFVNGIFHASGPCRSSYIIWVSWRLKSRQLNGLSNRLFTLTTKEISKPHMTSWFPSQKAYNTECHAMPMKRRRNMGNFSSHWLIRWWCIEHGPWKLLTYIT